jgi:uncharacterized protein (DUF2062 family)
MKRAKPKTLKKKFREAVWPAMGWRRTFHYYRHRMFRGGDSTYRIAGGLATGAAVCFSPFLGTHIMQIFLFCWLLRTSVIAGLIGSMIGTPWTYPLIYWMAYKVGTWICSLFGMAGFIALPEGMAFHHFLNEPISFLRYLLKHPQKMLLPLTVGGYLCGILLWPVLYAIVYYPVRRAQALYRLQRHHRGKGRKRLPGQESS